MHRSSVDDVVGSSGHAAHSVAQELYTALEENILALSSFKSSQFYLPFAAKVEHWEKTLANISEIVDAIQAVQRAWMYLENVFRGSEDIRPHLPDESTMFDEVNDGRLGASARFEPSPPHARALSASYSANSGHPADGKRWFRDVPSFTSPLLAAICGGPEGPGPTFDRQKVVAGLCWRRTHFPVSFVLPAGCCSSRSVG